MTVSYIYILLKVHGDTNLRIGCDDGLGNHKYCRANIFYTEYNCDKWRAASPLI